MTLVKQSSVLGRATVQVPFEGKEHTIPLIVARMHGVPPLLGRNWLYKINSDWISPWSDRDDSDTVLGQYSVDIWRRIWHNDQTAKLKGHDNAQPVFCRPRPVPYAIKDEVDKELDRHPKDGIIVKVE